MKKMLLIFMLVAVLVMPAIGAVDEEPEASVRVNAPEFVSGTFEVTIDVEDVTDFDSGEFNLTFNPSVVSFVDVESGHIAGHEVPIDMFDLIDDGRVHVLFNIKGADGVSGSGYIAKVIFEMGGVQGDTSVMAISDGELVGVNPDMDTGDSSTWTIDILADWFNDTVTIGIAPSTSAETPTPTQSPTIAAASAPEQTVTSIRTSAPDPGSPAFTTRAGDAPAGTASDASSENSGLQDVITTHNFISIYSFVGLLAFIYSLTLLK